MELEISATCAFCSVSLENCFSCQVNIQNWIIHKSVVYVIYVIYD